MGKHLLSTLFACGLTLTAMAQGWPAQYGGVMLQGFYWDSFDDSQWTELTAMTEQIKGTFDLVWLPQSGNCGGTSMGYDDLYWFSNYNSSFGNEQQLRQLIDTYKQNGIKTLADVVINHRRNVSNWVDFPKETYKGVTYEMTAADIVADDDDGKTKTWATLNGYQLSQNNDTGEGWDGMRDLDHKSPNVQNTVKAYLGLLRNDLGYAGFRYDMVKGYSAEYTALYNAAAQPEFSVGECWDGTNTIRRWIDGTQVSGTEAKSAAFDFQFRYTVRNACNNGQWNRLGQQNDNSWPLVSSNYESGSYRRWAVTFVENHDTEKRANALQDPLKRDTLAANAFLLAMPGTPCVFLKHWQSYAPQIKAMVAARKTAAITNESSYLNMRSTTDYYVNIIKNGDDKVLAVAVGDIAASDQVLSPQQWVKVVEGYHYAYYLPVTLLTAYADMPSGTYTVNSGADNKLTVRLAAVTAADGAQLVYTTDGSLPTAASTHADNGTTVSIGVGTTTMKVGLLVGGEVSGVVSYDYVVKEKEAENTTEVEIPAFCTVGDGETCAFFEAPLAWGDIKCWRWDKSYNYTGNQWPGVDCTLLGTAKNGRKVWKWSWNGEKKSQQSPNEGIIFNDGSKQTADLPFENGGYYTEDGLAANVIMGIDDMRLQQDGQGVSGSDHRKNLLYDLKGQRVYKPTRKGLYIRNGRKLHYQ